MEYFRPTDPSDADPRTALVGNIQPVLDQLDIDMSCPNGNEMKKCLKHLKHPKAAGYDDISGEMPKSG